MVPDGTGGRNRANGPMHARPRPAETNIAIAAGFIDRRRPPPPHWLQLRAASAARLGEDHMAQTIEGFVGNALDEAKISPLHIRVIALIAAGYFFDVIDLIVLGSLIPDMVQTKFATGAEAGLVGTATVFGMFIGA